MTEVAASSSQQQHHSAPSGPLTRSAMAARPAGAAGPPAAAGQHGSETSPAAPLSSSSGPPPPAPQEPSHEPRRRSITKKRAASINTEEANRAKIESLSLSTAGTASPRPFDTSGGLICLCTPAPKVPRPRNAFILYRQHHQAQVVQQNPGLANPEISKIIGEQWREEPEERKNQWKLLAEEEKQHHQRKYPDYRYQPRRGNKGGSGGSESARPTAAPGEDPHRCSKCGGRFIATPRTPSTPFTGMTPTTAKPGSTTPYGPPSMGRRPSLTPRPDMGRHRQQQWGGPQTAPGLYDIHEDYDTAMSPNGSKRLRYNAAGGAYHNFHALPSPPPPFTPAGGHHPSSHQHHPRQHSLSSNPSTPAGYLPPGAGGPSSSLPGPSSMLPRSSPGPGPMPPPPRPSHSLPVSAPMVPHYPAQQGYHHHQQHHPSHHPPLPRTNTNTTGSANMGMGPGGMGPGGMGPGGMGPGGMATPEFDESLRLPPLQTHLPGPGTTSPESEPSTGGIMGPSTAMGGAAGLGILHPTPTMASYAAGSSGGGVKRKRERERDEQARSVEAMVMSIGFGSKLRVLERISPPLAASSFSSSTVVGVGGAVGGRGPVIAIEGPDARLVRSVAAVVERALKGASPAEEGWEVRCWEDESGVGGGLGRGEGDGEDVVMAEAGVGAAVSRHGSLASIVSTASAGGGVNAANTNPFTAYLRTITDWHDKSAEIVKFVTGNITSSPSTSTATTPTGPPPQARLSTSSTSTTTTSPGSTTDPNKTEPEPEPDSETTPRPRRRPLPSHPSNPPQDPTTTTTTTTTEKTKTPTEKNTKLPIALLPSGFSLTLSDRFACAVPISDAYAPVDHWQWMATLWRGIVGADLVVYVTGKHSTGGGGGGGGGGEEGVGSVEVRSSGLVVVRVPVVAVVGGQGQEYGMAVDEKMERRLGFEVVEWVRGGGWADASREGLMQGMEY